MKTGYMNIINSRNAKIAICAVAILALLYVVFIQGQQSVDADRATRATEGIEFTSRQAEDMTKSAEAISTLLEGAPVDVSSKSPPTVDTTPTAQDTQSGMSDSWYVRRAEELASRWDPRYTAAIDDIDKFEHRFRTAEDRLEEYFIKQSELTKSINDPSLLAELQNRDSEEQVAYARWTAEGRQLLAQAKVMRKDLDDMNTVIRKQELTVNMLNQYSGVRTIPASVENLHKSLSNFRVQSDELASDLSSQVFN